MAENPADERQPAVVEQAAGMLQTRDDLSHEEALDALTGRATVSGRPLVDVAHEVVSVEDGGEA